MFWKVIKCFVLWSIQIRISMYLEACYLHWNWKSGKLKFFRLMLINGLTFTLTFIFKAFISHFDPKRLTIEQFGSLDLILLFLGHFLSNVLWQCG